jgi:hypothetical protein
MLRFITSLKSDAFVKGHVILPQTVALHVALLGLFSMQCCKYSCCIVLFVWF